MAEEGEQRVRLGDYIVLQRQGYRKLHKFSRAGARVALGRDTLDLSGLEGSRYHAHYKLAARGGGKSRTFALQPAGPAPRARPLARGGSGADNRHILDDGRSQKLSAAEIDELKNDATSSSDIVGTLISNSNTFHSKTEFSQEKYLKKKEKKYFEFVQIKRPNLRLITEIMYRTDPTKIQGIRVDTLSQILTYSNINSEGNHLLYDSGSNGLLTAALLNAIGGKTTGRLVHMHPGNMSQKQALLAMNFDQEQLDRCISVNIYSALRQYYQGHDLNTNGKLEKTESIEENPRKRCIEGAGEEIKSKIPKLENSIETSFENEDSELPSTDTTTLEQEIGDVKDSEGKKPKWHFDNISAAEVLKEKMDSLVIVCKEDPLNIFNELVQFVKPSRPFVIYYSVMEPLQQCYMSLKSRPDVSALKLTYNWLRNYQVLPERTHPEVTMNSSSGFLLTGYVLKK